MPCDLRCEHGLHREPWLGQVRDPCLLQGHQDAKCLHVCRRAAEAWGLWGEVSLSHFRPACCDGLLLLAPIQTPNLSQTWCIARTWRPLDTRLPAAGGKGAEQHLPAGQHWRGHAILSESRDLSKQRVQCQGEQAALMLHLDFFLPACQQSQSA